MELLVEAHDLLLEFAQNVTVDVNISEHFKDFLSIMA